MALIAYGLVLAGSASVKPVVKPKPAPTATQPALATPSPSPTPAVYDHVVVIVLENHSFDSVIGSAQAPYLNSFANSWALATGYSAFSVDQLRNVLATGRPITLGVRRGSDQLRLSVPPRELAA